jgi:prepilin-type N-terminal cleavage/methylation domain-containing protein
MKTKQQEGFTLVEVLVAISIFTFALLGLAAGTVSVTRTNQHSHLNASAINLAQAKLEELRAMSGTAFSGLSCPSSTPCSDSVATSGITYNRQWWITANSPVSGVNRIDLNIAWTDYQSHSLNFSASVLQ